MTERWFDSMMSIEALRAIRALVSSEEGLDEESSFLIDWMSRVVTGPNGGGLEILSVRAELEAAVPAHTALLQSADACYRTLEAGLSAASAQADAMKQAAADMGSLIAATGASSEQFVSSIRLGVEFQAQAGDIAADAARVVSVTTRPFAERVAGIIADTAPTTLDPADN